MTTETKEEVRERLAKATEHAERIVKAYGFSKIQIDCELLVEVSSQLAQLTRERSDCLTLIADFGDKITDMFEQMEKGNWTDDHSHDVRVNAAMCALIEPVQKAIELRAALAMGKEKE